MSVTSSSAGNLRTFLYPSKPQWIINLTLNLGFNYILVFWSVEK
jgi:hypothetical protein